MLLNPLCCAVLLLSVLHLAPRENEVFYDVVAIVDPLTREAQKMSSLLIVSYFLLLEIQQGHPEISLTEKKLYRIFFLVSY